MKKSGIYVVILLVLLVAAAVVSITSLTRDRSGADGQDKTPGTETTASAPVTSAAPTAPAESQTPVVTETPEPTPTPTPTPVPTPTPTPEPTPTPTPAPVYNAQGSFRSNTGTALNLVVDWAVSGTAGASTLTVTVSAESFSIYSVANPGGIKLTVGSNSYTLDAAALSYGGEAMTTQRLATTTVPLPDFSGDLSASVSWLFRGTYGKTELDTITASGAIHH